MCQCTPMDGTLAAFTLILNRLDALEATIMTTQAEAFATVSAKIDDIRADFQALLNALAVERENLSEAGQAKFDELVAKVDALDVAVGDADGSDAPAPEPTPEPAPEAPAEG